MEAMFGWDDGKGMSEQSRNSGYHGRHVCILEKNYKES